MKKHLLVLLSFAFANTFNAQNYYVSTVAGTGTQGLVDGQATTVAEMYWPYGLAYDGDSVIFFSDALNHVIRKVNLNTNIVKTIAGTGGVPGLQDGIGVGARFNSPDGLVYKNGILYIGDNLNNCVRAMNVQTYSVSTFAGTGTAGYLDGTANSAMFRGGNGLGLAIDKNGDIYVGDGSNAVIRKIHNGQVSTFAGTPGVYGLQNGSASTAKFHRPRYLCVDTATGAVYTTDINNNVIRKVLNNIVSTFSGTGVAGGMDGAANVATFASPVGIAITYNGYFYVIDGQGNKLRKMDPSGTVTTIAGNGVFGFQDGAAANAEFNLPQGLCYDKHCFIYMADRDNNRIRRVSVPEGPVGCLTGVSSITKPSMNLMVYPNPSSGTVTVEILNSSEPAVYRIYNTVGQEIKTGSLSLSSNEITLQNLPDGIYSVIVTQTGINSTAKVSIQR